MFAPLLLLAYFNPDPTSSEAPATAAKDVPQAAVVPPKLAVLVVIDQYSWTLHERMFPHTEPEGGFQTAATRGFVGPARYAHATTYTCPGHATLSTGASPRTHGIIGNRWLNQGEVQYCADLELLEAQTLADRVVGEGGMAVSLSLKDRAALMLGGQHPTAVAWFERTEGGWSTSELPYLQSSALLPILDTPWTALKPELYASLFPDDNPYEGDVTGWGTTFPKAALGAENAGTLRYHPGIARALVDGALGAVDHHKLGQDDSPDLLAISFSQIDYLGHAYTAESWEVMDAYLRLDRDLKVLLDGLDQRFGPDGYVFAISSDHGAAPANSTRIDPETVSSVGLAAYADLGLPDQPTFAERAFWLPPSVTDTADRDRAAKAIAKAAGQVEGVHTAVAVMSSGLWPGQGPPAEAVKEVVYPGRTADVMVILESETIFMFGDSKKGTSHGVPWTHDSRVPLFITGTGVQTGTLDTDVDVRQLAPTLTALLGLPPLQHAERPAMMASDAP